MGWAEKLRPALLPALLAWPAGSALADSCSLTLLNSVPLTVTNNVASVPASVDSREKLFQVDTAAPDNQMARDAMTEFGLTAVDFTPSQNGGGAAGFSLGQLSDTRIDGAAIGLSMTGSIGGAATGNAVAIYNAKGVMFHSWADAGRFTLGSMQTEHVKFVVTDQPQPGSGGIISTEFLKRFDIDLNFRAQRLNLFAPDHCKGEVLYWRAPGVAKLPFTYRNGRITVRVSVDGREMNAAIDTGSPRSEMQFDDTDSLFYRNSLSNGVMREPDGHYAYNYGSLSFGGVSIFNPHLVLTHSALARNLGVGPQTGTMLRNFNPDFAQPDLTIGTDLLKLLHVYIAFNERMVYVTQGSELPEGDAKALPVVRVTPFRP